MEEVILHLVVVASVLLVVVASVLLVVLGYLVAVEG
jgi:hypothetical protein